VARSSLVFLYNLILKALSGIALFFVVLPISLVLLVLSYLLLKSYHLIFILFCYSFASFFKIYEPEGLRWFYVKLLNKRLYLFLDDLEGEFEPLSWMSYSLNRPMSYNLFVEDYYENIPFVKNIRREQRRVLHPLTLKRDLNAMVLCRGDYVDRLSTPRLR